jgi:transposase
MICDSHGNPLDFVLTQGQINDCTQSSTLLAGREAVAVISAMVAIACIVLWLRL